jgi:uracil phosphoribosyltransferase
MAGKPGSVTVVSHPLVQHKLTIMRKKETSVGKFRRLASEIAMLLAYEVTRDMPTVLEDIETPLMHTRAPVLKGREIVLVSILRAGNGILDGMLRLIPSAHVGHIGLYREPKTHVAVEYYFKMPPNLPERDVIVVDPMLATGHSAVAAVDRIKEKSPRSLKFVCLLAAPEGIEFFHEHHPDVPIFTAAIDQGLNEKKYIVPGLGDAGDRLFGTL